MTKHWVGKSVVGVVVGAAVVVATTAGAGQASAKIEAGFYELTTVVTGGPSFTPTSEAPSNARVIGNRLFYDESGVGPWNTNQYVIRHTRGGGTVTPGGIGDLIYRAELRKTHTGYKGPLYLFGVPYGELVLRKVDRSESDSFQQTREARDSTYETTPDIPGTPEVPDSPEGPDFPAVRDFGSRPHEQ